MSGAVVFGILAAVGSLRPVAHTSFGDLRGRIVHNWDASAKAEARLLLDDRKELIKNLIDGVLVQSLHRIHCGAKVLYLARREVAQDLRCLIFTDQHHKYR